MIGTSMLANTRPYAQLINTLAGDKLGREGMRMSKTVCMRPDQKLSRLSSFF
jgi:hypothetical protein